MGKPKFALYWAASCGGCEIAFLDIREKLLDFDAAAELVFCPCVMDTKYADVEAMADGEIDVALFNGGIRNEENLHVARLLRRKAKVLVAFGACAVEGGIPGLANLTTREEILDYAFHRAPTVTPGDGDGPRLRTETPAGDLTLPEIFPSLRTLAQVVDVDYRLPGCPPVADQIWAVAETILSGKLPAKGALVGVNPKTVCDECPRTKEEKKVKAFRRPHLVPPRDIDAKACLLEQGLLCAGPAVHAGCGALCPRVNLGCRGCYGPAEGVRDIGAKLAGSIASIIDSNDPADIQAAVDGIVDPVGTFYRFSLAGSLVGGRVR